MILAIDGGTTNTRFCLVDKGRILGAKKVLLGIRDTFTPEGRETYRSMIRTSLTEMTEAPLQMPEAVVASGMITSETGLCFCPHAALPQDFRSLAASLIPAKLPLISAFPFYFVPGVKTAESARAARDGFAMEHLAEMDIMRGEETELVGICTRLSPAEPHTLILPGSHTKYIFMDSGDRIQSFRTSLTGELIRSVTEHTILKSSLGNFYPVRVDTEYLWCGYSYAREYGMTDAMFKVRILEKSVSGIQPEQLYSFLLGIVLCDDIVRLVRNGRPVYIGGSGLFRSAFCELLTRCMPSGGVHEIPADTADYAAAYGAEWLYRMYKTIS